MLRGPHKASRSPMGNHSASRKTSTSDEVRSFTVKEVEYEYAQWQWGLTTRKYCMLNSGLKLLTNTLLRWRRYAEIWRGAMHTLLRSSSTPLGPAVRRSCAVDLQPTAAAVLGSIARASDGRRRLSAEWEKRPRGAAAPRTTVGMDEKRRRLLLGGREGRRGDAWGERGGEGRGQLAVCSVAGVPSVARSFGRSRTAAGVCQRAGAGGAGLTVGRIVGRTGGSRMLPAATAAAAAAASQCPALTLCWSLTTPAPRTPSRSCASCAVVRRGGPRAAWSSVQRTARLVTENYCR